MRPEAQEGCQVSDWFNILVLHQNRLCLNECPFVWFLSVWVCLHACFIHLFWKYSSILRYIWKVKTNVCIFCLFFWESWNYQIIWCLDSYLGLWFTWILPSMFTCRVKTNPKNAINEQFLPRFLDFIVWGHEHECLVDPQVRIMHFPLLRSFC